MVFIILVNILVLGYTFSRINLTFYHRIVQKKCKKGRQATETNPLKRSSFQSTVRGVNSLKWNLKKDYLNFGFRSMRTYYVDEYMNFRPRLPMDKVAIMPFICITHLLALTKQLFHK